MVVPFSPGAATDVIPRLLSDGMSKTLGAPIVIDNRPGSGGTAGTAAAARASPDGYTLLATVNPTVTLDVYLQKSVSYDPRTAFAPVTLMASSFVLLAVHPSMPVHTVTEFIEYAKANPGKISYGTPGVGTGPYMLGELLKLRAHIDITEISYRGVSPMLVDLAGGQIQAGMGSPAALLPLAHDGKIRVIALGDRQRQEELPDIPAISETVPGVVSKSWYAIYAPAGTPEPIVDALNKAAKIELVKPAIVEKLRMLGAYARGSTPEELGEITSEELDQWAREIPLMGLMPK
jgi:tripartite-type tricarboxylate transporter receptor subunit TctC